MANQKKPLNPHVKASTSRPVNVPEVMNVEEVAAYLDLAVTTIYQKISERSIPYTKIRNIVRFQKTTIDEWLQQNTIYPEPSTFEEFARWYSRHTFKEWLKSKGQKPNELSQKELNELARQSLNDLLDDQGERFPSPAWKPEPETPAQPIAKGKKPKAK